MKLPQEFKDQMIKMLGEDGFAEYETAFEKPMFHALRVNTLKISVEDFLKISPFELKPVPWCKNGFYYDADKYQASKHPYYYAGLYYLQEPSAMVPASFIPIEPGDKVLDLCAAPGGKTTELAARLAGTGYLVSNDVSASRAKALIKNIEVFGIDNVLVTCEPGEKLSQVFAGYFDKILIDAPCSGEGMFRKSGSMITAWEQNGKEMFATLQRSILKEAVKMLRPGGTILYSTCTFNGLEDEDSVMYLLSLREDLNIIPINMYDGFVPGNPDWCINEKGIDDLRYTAHLFPHKIDGEGHFVSMIHDSSDPESSNAFVSDYYPKRIKLPDELKDFLSHISINFSADRFEEVGGRVYYIPDGCPENGRLHVLRRGLLMGELKTKRFEPSQALAMKLKSDEFDNVLDLSSSDQRVIKYLKGETIDGNDDTKDGWVLISVDGFPLGFGKCKNQTIKNKYLPGWRMV